MLSLNSGGQQADEEDRVEDAAAAAGRISNNETYGGVGGGRRHEMMMMMMGGGSRSASASASASAAAHSSSLHLLDEIRPLVISCGDLISRSDLGAANRLLSALSAKSTPYGDSTQRLLHHFATALRRRARLTTTIHHLNYSTTPATATATSTATHTQQAGGLTTAVDYYINENAENKDSTADDDDDDAPSQSDDGHMIHSCYLTLNQITPFIRFSHLTANQAILDHAVDDATQALHILDFDIMHGLQWPPFMQALADRSSPAPALRITATGHDLPLLRRTGDRLLRFAHSLGLRFHFQPLLLPADHDDAISLILSSNPRGEALAVNCVLYLHRLLDDHDCHSHKLRRFLQGVKALNPRVVTVAEREANLGGPHALAEALDHYAAIFDSLEATLPPNSRERLSVEQVWLSREIAAAVADSGSTSSSGSAGRRLRSQRYESWEALLRSCGFSNVPLSPFALSQAKLLLRLHYPSEGFQLHILNHSFFLGWQNRPLFSLSSWH